MSSICVGSLLINALMCVFTPTFFEAKIGLYQKGLKGDNIALIKKMKIVQKLAYNTRHENTPNKLFTREASVIAHIIKLFALIGSANPEEVNQIWFDTIECAEETQNEGDYLSICNKVKLMKQFYDFIIPAGKRTDFIIELENDNEGDWIHMTYCKK